MIVRQLEKNLLNALENHACCSPVKQRWLFRLPGKALLKSPTIWTWINSTHLVRIDSCCIDQFDHLMRLANGVIECCIQLHGVRFSAIRIQQAKQLITYSRFCQGVAIT